MDRDERGRASRDIIKQSESDREPAAGHIDHPESGDSRRILGSYTATDNIDSSFRGHTAPSHPRRNVGTHAPADIDDSVEPGHAECGPCSWMGRNLRSERRPDAMRSVL